MKRRELLVLAAGAAASVIAAAAARPALADLEPDGKWLTYRRHSLVIVGQRDAKTASNLAEAVVNVLARALPSSRAQLAHAADGRRVGVLIGTKQQDVAIMTAESAEALFLAKPPFADMRNVPLRLIVSFGQHVLACRHDFLARHAYLLAQTLAEHKDALPTARAPDGLIPAHQGSFAFFAGKEMPNG
jgi:hypothetical protein